MNSHYARYSLIVSLAFVAGSSMAAFRTQDGLEIAAREEIPILRNLHGYTISDASGRQANFAQEEMELQAAAARLPISTRSKDNRLPGAAGTTHSWGYAVFGSGIGKSNIRVAEAGDGPELYLGGSTSTFGSDTYWYALSYEASTGTYEQVYVSGYHPVGIRRIEVGDVLGDVSAEIVVALDDGNLLIHDQVSKRLLQQVQTQADGLRGLEIYDVDGDGESELVLCTTDHLYVYSGSGVLEWDLPSVGGYDVVAGQMDVDPAVEIAVTGGQVIDGDSRSVEWTWPYGFGLRLEIGDIDDDGMEELIVAEDWYIIWSYDVDRQLPKWSIPIDLDIAAIYLTDIDGDAVLELLVGEGQWGSILAYDTTTIELEWSVSNPDHGVTAITVGDVDQDGSSELIWGAGASSTGDDHLYVVDWATQILEWRNDHLDGPFIGPELGDLDGDGRNEIVICSWESESGYGSGRVLVFDAATLRLRSISEEIVGGHAWTGTHDLELRDVDADGRLEILLAADDTYDGVIEIYDFEPDGTFNLIWSNPNWTFGAPFHSADAGDVDNDGELEIVGSVGREHTGAEGVFVYVYDYASGAEEWRSLQMGGYWDAIAELRLSDLDRDGTLEIIGMVDGGDVYIFDGESKELEAIVFGSHTSFEVVEGRSGPQLLLGDSAGNLSLVAYAFGSYDEVRRQRVLPGSIDGITADSIPGLRGRSATRFWLGSQGRLYHANWWRVSWQSDLYGTIFGQRVSVLPGRRMTLSAGSYALLGFSGRSPLAASPAQAVSAAEASSSSSSSLQLLPYLSTSCLRRSKSFCRGPGRASR